MKSKAKHPSSRGFSLVELLVVIAVLGIISAIAVVSLSGVNENSSVAAAQRQAQQIASVFGAGSATGAAGFKTATSVATAMNAVGIGSTGAGVMKNSSFQLAGVTSTMDDDKPLEQQAKHYLSWENGQLLYSPSGGGTSGGDTDGNPADPMQAWVQAMQAAALAYVNSHPGYDQEAFNAHMQNWVETNPSPNGGNNPPQLL